jgi:hypothetical protein
MFCIVEASTDTRISVPATEGIFSGVAGASECLFRVIHVDFNISNKRPVGHKLTSRGTLLTIRCENIYDSITVSRA